jgi:hypothetical protein
VATAGYDLLVPVDQNRRVEAEGGDAAGDRLERSARFVGENGTSELH